jgi:site-specific recombinase XerD
VLVGAALSREYIAHECAPTEINQLHRMHQHYHHLGDFHFHDLRHSFASNLVMKGVSLKAVAELLGHTSLKMVNVYLHLSEEYKKSAVELLDED